MRLLAFGIVGMAVALAGAPSARAACNNPAAVAAARAQVAAQCDCAGASNHGDYVSCAANVAKTRAAAGQLPQGCKDSVITCAANSVCGRPGAVTCCRVDGLGHVSCSIKSSADKCTTDAANALVCLGSGDSCCDACNQNSCQATTSTTTTSTSTSTSTSSTTTSTTLPYGSASRAFITPVPGLLE